MLSPTHVLNEFEKNILHDMKGSQQVVIALKLIDEITKQYEDQVVRLHLTGPDAERELVYKKLRAEGAKYVASLVRTILTTGRVATT